MSRKKALMIALLMVVFPYTGAMASGPAGGEDIAARWTGNALDDLPTELTYAAVEIFPAARGAEADSCLESIRTAVQLLDKRAAGEMTAEEAERWKHVDNGQLEEIIRSNERLLNGFRLDSTVVYANQGSKWRKDVRRPEEHNGHHYRLFDGEAGFAVTPDDKIVRTGEDFTLYSLNPAHSARPGSGIGVFLRNGYTVAGYDEAAGELTLAHPAAPGAEWVFTLLNDDPLYWRQCDFAVNGMVLERTVCGDFAGFGGLKVPQTAERFKEDGHGLKLVCEMTLLEAETKPEGFAAGFFEAPDAESFEVANLER